jgi:hypothetical protein
LSTIVLNCAAHICGVGQLLSVEASALQRHPWPPADPMHDVPELDVGRTKIYDFLFCRDFVAEDNDSSVYADVPGAVVEPTVDKLIKSMINFELHGLMDCAVQVAEHFRAKLASRFDVDEAVVHLARRPPHARNTADVVSTLRMVAALRLLVMEKDQLLASERVEFQRALNAQQAEFNAKLAALHAASVGE